MYQKNGVPYDFNDLRRDHPNVGFPRNYLKNPDARAEYGITEITKSDLPPIDIQSVDPNTPDGFHSVRGNPEFVDGEWRETWVHTEKSWLDNRMESYGAPDVQIEFITENGLEAWQSKVAEIKAKYPKS